MVGPIGRPSADEGANWRQLHDPDGAALDSAGVLQSFLVSEDTFKTLKTLEEKNLRPYSLRQFEAAAALCPIDAFIRAFRAGKVYANPQALACQK